MCQKQTFGRIYEEHTTPRCCLKICLYLAGKCLNQPKMDCWVFWGTLKRLVDQLSHYSAILAKLGDQLKQIKTN